MTTTTPTVPPGPAFVADDWLTINLTLAQACLNERQLGLVRHALHLQEVRIRNMVQVELWLAEMERTTP